MHFPSGNDLPENKHFSFPCRMSYPEGSVVVVSDTSSHLPAGVVEIPKVDLPLEALWAPTQVCISQPLICRGRCAEEEPL